MTDTAITKDNYREHILDNQRRIEEMLNENKKLEDKFAPPVILMAAKETTNLSPDRGYDRSSCPYDHDLMGLLLSDQFYDVMEDAVDQSFEKSVYRVDDTIYHIDTLPDKKVIVFCKKHFDADWFLEAIYQKHRAAFLIRHIFDLMEDFYTASRTKKQKTSSSDE